ncbi:unnamed protein product [Phytomonas sp. Hart1]|nr:unnamed protein product [Phytomonas sp. Hart1]|eukprot:CCW66527.1 unnamed protein product [Phytomonas sp. isolate Hart1]
MYSKGKKEQQPAKDLKIYELELLVKDLKTELKECNGLKDKLELANRNSCVLEEENVNLIRTLKTMGNVKTDSQNSTTSAGAMKLISENEDLRRALENSLSDLEKTKEGFQDLVLKLEGQIRQISEERDNIAKENERLVKDLDSSRHQYFELKNALDDELAISKAEIGVLLREKERLVEKNDYVISSKKSTDVSKGGNLESHSKSDAASISLKERLLKEDVEELEVKLKASAERLWQKENEWLLAEAKFRSEISALRDNKNKKTNDKEVYRALHDQISTLKRDLAALRENTFSVCRNLNTKHVRKDFALFSTEDMMINIDSSNPSIDLINKDENILPQSQVVLQNRVNSLIKERDDLHEDLDNLKTTLLQFLSDIEDRDIYCKELEIKLATSNQLNYTTIQTKPDSPLVLDYGLERKSKHLTRNSKFTQDAEVKALKGELKELQGQLNDLHAIQEQKDAIHNVRLTEYQRQIEELLDENNSLCQRLKSSSCEKTRLNINGQDGLEDVLDFLRDKRESVDEVMCHLESMWAKEEEASRQIRKSNNQGIAMTRYDAIKEDDMRQLQRTIVDLENQLVTEQSNHNLIDKLRGELVQKNNEILFLSDEINILSEDLHDAKRNTLVSSRISEREGRISKRRSRSARTVSSRRSHVNTHDSKINALEQQLVQARSEINLIHSHILKSSGRGMSASKQVTSINSQVGTPEKTVLLHNTTHSSEGTSKIEILEGAHLAITIVELSNLMRKGCLITDPGHVIIKLKSMKEKYKTSVKELKTIIKFDEAFHFFLAKPTQDVITLHVFYKSKNNSYLYHIGDACFSMATLCRGVPRRRTVPVVQYPGTDDACRAAGIEIILQTNDFGRIHHPSDAELKEEDLRYKNLTENFEKTAPEKLHAVDIYMASSALL